MKKARFFKFALIISGTAILAISLSAFLVYHYFPKDKILSIIISSAEETLKRKIIIQEIDYGLQGITLKNIRIYNNLYTDDKIPDKDILASVKEADIKFSLLPLLKKEFIISGIVLNNFKIHIIYDDGKSNLGKLLLDLKNSSESGIKTKISIIKFKNAEITLKNPPDILKPLEGRYVFNGTVNIHVSDSFAVTDCIIILPEERGTIYSDKIGVSVFENDFEVTGDCRLKKCSLLWVYKWVKDLSLPFTNFTGNVTGLKITKDFVEGFAKGDSYLTNSKIVNADGKCRVDLNKETVDLIKIRGEVEKSKFFINQIFFSFSSKIKDSLIRFNITDIDSSLIDAKGLLTFLNSNILNNLYGWVTGNISCEYKNFSGNLNLKNVSYRSNGKNILTVTSDISIKNNIIYKEKIPVSVYDQPGLLSISTSGNNFQKIILNFNAREFTYVTEKEAGSKKSSSQFNIKSEVSGRIDIDNLNINKYNFSNASLNYSVINNRINLNQASIGFMGGNIKGNGYVDFSRNEPYMELNAGFQEIKVQNLANLNSELSGRFFGIAKGNTEIKFGVNKETGQFDLLKGKIEFNIDKGKLVNTGIQKGLGIWLSELKYKLSNIEFNKIYGNINAAGNNFYINSMLFNSPDIRLRMDGAFGKPAAGTTRIPGDMKIDLEFTDFFIQDIPNLPQAQLISKLLKIPALKKRGDWYIMSFHDKGDDITDSNNIKPQ
ncbi:MAG: AsmA family protein [Spirochaetota bacterium]